MGGKADSAVLDGKVRDVAHGGDAVIETDRGIVFARGGLPGERVRVQLTRKAGGAQRAQLLELLQASPERVPAPCALAERCGGCPLMPLAQPAQARLKLAHLARVLEQNGCALEPEWIASPHALGYRARARLGFQRVGASAQVGYRAAGSHALVDIPECLVLAPGLQAGLTHIRERLAPLLVGEGELMLGLGRAGRCVAELMALRTQPAAVYAAADQLVAQGALAGLALRAGGPELAPAVFGDPRQVGTAPDAGPLWAEAAGFTQVNPELNALLVARVLALAEPRGAKLLELFAGHGNFTIGLAAESDELTAIESDPKAAAACRANLEARDLQRRVKIVRGDAAEAIPARRAFDVVVLDPPRSGARAALPAILARKPSRIVYVSCDLASLQRDLADLLAAGYRVDAAAGFDMFPQTSHMESVIRLVRGG